ncbi:pseudouridine synthase, partial [Pseudomonas aeruginosa]|nr:pseudouridine synthase [Pseudomonas aeruginosa]
PYRRQRQMCIRDRRPRESNRKPRPSKPRDERPASAPGDKPAARKPQVKRRPKPAGDGMRPGFRR